MAHTIVHFEIPSDNNIERANKFYNDLFGWKMEKVPGPMEYWMFATGANNKGEQTIGGGVMERKIPSSHEQITIYIAVNSVNEYVKRVEELGGKVIKPKTEVRSYGWFALCMDTENITFSLCGRLIRNKRTPFSLLIFWCIFITLPSTLFLA